MTTEPDGFASMIKTSRSSDFVSWCIDFLDRGIDMTRCKYDTDGDGNCHRCYRLGGCLHVGGPFPEDSQSTTERSSPDDGSQK